MAWHLYSSVILSDWNWISSLLVKRPKMCGNFSKLILHFLLFPLIIFIYILSFLTEYRLTHGKSSFSFMLELTIKNVSHSDTGAYTCVINSRPGTAGIDQESTFTVDVKCKFPTSHFQLVLIFLSYTSLLSSLFKNNIIAEVNILLEELFHLTPAQ